MKQHASKQACGAQLLRLNTIPKWMPQTKAGQAEIVRALEKHCVSDAHAERVMTTFLQETVNCDNVVAELARIARDTQGIFSDSTLPEACEKCHGRPFVDVFRDGMYKGQGRCTCERGRALLAKDRERFAARDRQDKARGEMAPARSIHVG